MSVFIVFVEDEQVGVYGSIERAVRAADKWAAAIRPPRWAYVYRGGIRQYSAAGFHRDGPDEPDEEWKLVVEESRADSDTPFGRHAYLSLADELSADPNFMDDADGAYVVAAHAYALALDLPWPPVPDVDIASDLIERSRWGDR